MNFLNTCGVTYREGKTMDKYTATEQAYKHGYEKGYADGKPKWIPVSERLPQNFVSVLGYMTDAGDFPPVRECYTVGNAFFFPALCDKHPVSHWMPLPEPPKEEKE